MASIGQALAAIELLGPGESINYAKIAKQFNVDRSTLSRRHRGVQHSKDAQYESQRNLNHQQAKELVGTINELIKRGLYPSHEMLRNLAEEVTGTKPGKHWPSRFLNRHSKDLVSDYRTAINATRKQADSASEYALYFEHMDRKIKEYGIEAENIYSMDEKGFLIGSLSNGKRIFSKQHCLHLRGRDLASPGLIYQAVSGNVADSWQQDFSPDDHHCFLASSASGRTNNKLEFAWLQHIFDRETKAKARGRWRLLILDGHGFHITMKFINFCNANRILLMIYPPHLTHSLQPLEVGIFGPLSMAYSTELEAFLRMPQGQGHVTKRDFFRLFWPSWEKVLSKNNIESAWRSVGIWPWNPEIVLTRFSKEENQRTPSSQPSRSILQEEDWEKIERHLNRVVSDIFNENTENMNLTIHHLSTENTLLEQRCRDLENALQNERRKRQRETRRTFELQAPEDGSAVSNSPKIQQARDLQTKNKQATQLAKASKEQEKQIFEEEEPRLPAADVKRKQKEDFLAKKAAIRLQTDFKQAKKGKKRKQDLASRPANQQDTIAPDAEVVVEAPSMVTRRGRQIRLPHRFRDA